MAWPSANISLSNVDADSDSISSARADIYQAFTSLNDIIQVGPGSGGTGTYSNANVASYLPVYAGNIAANVVTTSGNINLKSAGQVILANNNTGAFVLPTGNTLQRANVAGAIRYNTETGNPEWYSGGLSAWKLFSQQVAPSYNARYLIVAGGGGGGRGGASGGGAGGLLTSNVTINSGGTYTITVGAGGGANAGTGSAPIVNTGFNGSDSSIVYGSAIGTAVGGGGGGPNYSQAGGDGGSGGGGGEGGGRGGYGTSGQGFDGGYASEAVESGYWPGSGGGGAGAVGFNANARYAGAGGAGVTNNITGATVTYAGGGGGSSYGGAGYAGAGGAGGGGAGAGGSGGSATNGTNGLGGGAGAGTNGTGGTGGSGIVIISVPNANYPGNAYVTNGNVTYSGDNTIITWTTSGSYIG